MTRRSPTFPPLVGSAARHSPVQAGGWRRRPAGAWALLDFKHEPAPQVGSCLKSARRQQDSPILPSTAVDPAGSARVDRRDSLAGVVEQGPQLRWADDLDLATEGEHLGQGRGDRIDSHRRLDPVFLPFDRRGLAPDAHANRPSEYRGQLPATPPGKSEFDAWRDEASNPPALVVQVGATQLRYHLRCIEDLHAMLKEHGDWVPLGNADEQKPVQDGTVEAWGRSPDNPVGGWYGLKKGLRGRLGNYVPPVLEALGLAEVEHNARNNRMRAV
jgi:hypothetical protein